MKKLNKRFFKRQNTIEAYGLSCSCYCNAAYCAATWQSQQDWESRNNFSSDFKN